MSSQNYYIPHDPSFRTLVTCAQRVDAVRLLEPVDARDVRMIQRRRELGLALEPGEALGVARELDGAREHCAQAEHKQASAGTHGIPLSTEESDEPHETLHTLAVDGRPLRFEYLRHHAAAEKWTLQM